MLTLYSLFEIYRLNPNVVRLVRHSNRELPVLSAFRESVDYFTEYTAWQGENKYKSDQYLAVFGPSRGTTAIFLGIWEIKGCTLNKDLTTNHLRLLKKYSLPERWFERSVRYDLKYSQVMADLSERLIIDWGKSTVSWVQQKDKPVVAINPRESIEGFTSYDEVQLTWDDLSRLRKDTDANYTWIRALSSVNGVYLIRDSLSGQLYVGCAYGKDGIWGRWKGYAHTGHGGNKLLKSLDWSYFEYSILEIAPATFTADQLIERENRWKVRLGSRALGLNSN
ncbi:MAG: GIY-YIG nuclease family protein [Porticoccaceae bacterium]|nr:GIY-YIG nuclease family protein [Porticoccaceae bacterium]